MKYAVVDFVYSTDAEKTGVLLEECDQEIAARRLVHSGSVAFCKVGYKEVRSQQH